MPILDDAAANASLANDFGPTRGANAPDSHEVELWDGDPTIDGSAELSGNGYAPATVLPAAWSTPAGRAISALATFGTPSGPWDESTHYVLRGDDGNLWDFGAWAESLQVTEAGDPPTAAVEVFYRDPTEV